MFRKISLFLVVLLMLALLAGCAGYIEKRDKLLNSDHVMYHERKWKLNTLNMHSDQVVITNEDGTISVIVDIDDIELPLP